MPNLTKMKSDARASQAKRAADKIKDIRARPRVKKSKNTTTKSTRQSQSQSIVINNTGPAKRAPRKPRGANSKPPSSSDGILLALLDTFKKADLSREQRMLSINPPRTEPGYSFTRQDNTQVGAGATGGIQTTGNVTTQTVGAGATGGMQAGGNITVKSGRTLTATEVAQKEQVARARMRPANMSFLSGGQAGGGGNKGYAPRMSAMSSPYTDPNSGGGLGNAMSASVRHRLETAIDLGSYGFIDDDGSGFF